MKNPYKKQPGFNNRVNYAARWLLTHYLHKKPTTRGFDNCFENNDGDAVMWQLVWRSRQANSDLFHALIKYFDKSVLYRFITEQQAQQARESFVC